MLSPGRLAGEQQEKAGRNRDERARGHCQHVSPNTSALRTTPRMLPPSAGGIENSLRTRAESLASRYWRLQKVFSKKYWRVCEARDLCFPPLACGIQQNTRTPVPKVIHAVLLTINPSSRARASGEASTNNSTPAGDARREHREQITGLGATCAVNICKYLDEGSYFCTHTHTHN